MYIVYIFINHFFLFMTANNFHLFMINALILKVPVEIKFVLFKKRQSRQGATCSNIHPNCCLKEQSGANITPPTLWQGLNVSSGTSGIALALLFVQEVWTTPNLPIPLHIQHIIMGQWDLNKIPEDALSFEAVISGSVSTDKLTKPNKVSKTFLFPEWVIH